jgi:hypothetical protein
VILYSSDADLEYDPTDYPNLLDPLTQGKADVVYGSRFLGSRRHRVLASGAKTPSNDRALPLSAIILTFFGKEGITSFENVVRCSQHVTGVLAGIHIFRKRQAQEHLMIAVWLEEVLHGANSKEPLTVNRTHNLKLVLNFLRTQILAFTCQNS